MARIKINERNMEIRGKKIARREAVLCAILGNLQERGLLDEVVSEIDWTEASACASGEWVLNWFEDHKAKDAARRGPTPRELALAKLTADERTLLGLD